MQIAACRRRQATAASTPTYARRSASRARSGNGTPFVWCGVLWAARIFLSLYVLRGRRFPLARGEPSRRAPGPGHRPAYFMDTLWILYGYFIEFRIEC